jgi:leucyl-tRNA synthetase
MRQWMLRITAYADRLLQDLETIEWSHSLKEMQRNWIGRSEGAEVDFAIAECGMRSAEYQKAIRVFTTRPDTLFGATYMVLAPEHKLVDAITTQAQQRAVEAYKTEVAKKSDRERTELAKEKTGVFTGGYAINPVNGEKIPIWIADYVLISYGTGAIMAVPGHDTRDFEFATKFNLPIVKVVEPPAGTDWHGYIEDGVSVNSAGAEISISGLPTPEAKRKITAWLESNGLGKKTINYKLRDWLFSRQRYWGEPFPIIWKTGPDGRTYHEALPESALPLLPPRLDDYKPTPDGQPPLARAQDWVNLPDGSRRETNTMPQWAGSCWYYLRYLDVKNCDRFVNARAENYWMGYSRLRVPCNVQELDASIRELVELTYSDPGAPRHRVAFGEITAELAQKKVKAAAGNAAIGALPGMSQDDRRTEIVSQHLPHVKLPTPGVDLYVGGTEHAVLHLLYARFWHKVLFDLGQVSTPEPFYRLVNQGLILGEDGQKMSKSRGNVINPDDILVEYGADAFRLYEMFMGPLEMVKPWNTKGVEGVYRFLGRVWRLFVDEQSETEFEQSLTTEPQRGTELLGTILLAPGIADTQPTAAQLKALHACIKKVTEDLDGLRFNTAISALMVFINEAMTWETKPLGVLRDFLILLQPFAPHIAEELWAKLHAASHTKPVPGLSYAAWPKFDSALLVEDTLEIPVQINGKLRDVIKVPATISQADLDTAARASEKVKPFLEGKTIRKVIVLPKKLVNIVAN